MTGFSASVRHTYANPRTRARQRLPSPQEEAEQRRVPVEMVMRERRRLYGDAMAPSAPAPELPATPSEQKPAAEAAQALEKAAIARRRRRCQRRAALKRFLARRIALDSSASPPRHDVKEIARRVRRATGVTMAELEGTRREWRIVDAKQCVFYWSKRLTGRSYPAIARLFGCCHTTVMYGAKAWPENRLRRRARRQRGLL